MQLFIYFFYLCIVFVMFFIYVYLLPLAVFLFHVLCFVPVVKSIHIQVWIEVSAGYVRLPKHTSPQPPDGIYTYIYPCSLIYPVLSQLDVPREPSERGAQETPLSDTQTTSLTPFKANELWSWRHHIEHCVPEILSMKVPNTVGRKAQPWQSPMPTNNTRAFLLRQQGQLSLLFMDQTSCSSSIPEATPTRHGHKPSPALQSTCRLDGHTPITPLVSLQE